MLVSVIISSVSADSLLSDKSLTIAPFVGNIVEISENIQFQFAPDNLYPFIFRGSNPYTWIDIDTTKCEYGCMYVYNNNSGTLVRISNTEIDSYIHTQDAVYLLTTNNEVIKADYNGGTFNNIYKADGAVTNYISFGSLLYFIEDNCRIVAIDMMNDQVHMLLMYENIVQVNVFDQNKVLWYTGDDKVYYTNLATAETIPVLCELQEEKLIYSRYTERTGNSNATYSTRTVSTLTDGYNDIPLPFEDEYQAVLGTGITFKEGEVISWFGTKNDSGVVTSAKYANSRQCDGFAKYAHDRFWHIADWDRTTPSWIINGHNTNDVKTDSIVWRTVDWNKENPDYSKLYILQNFYNDLDVGSFVRYGKADDDDPGDGVHSIVYCGMTADKTGIYAYEANQDYNNGVGYRLYDIQFLYRNYESILYYVEHSLASSPTYESTTYHTVECNNCDGFLRQTHTAASTYKYDGTYHWNPCTGCGGDMLKAKHIKILDANGSYKCRICGCKVFDNSFQSVLVNDEA